MTLEPASMAPIIRDCVQRLQGVHPDVQIEIDVPDELPVVNLDSTRVAQVLDNMLNNAQKYAPGSPITIKAFVKGEQLWIEVHDEGPGIPAEHTPHLFERFYRMPQSSNIRGTGLGLYISRKIIEAHGGEIGVLSQAGKGATFFFEIPMVNSTPLE